MTAPFRIKKISSSQVTFVIAAGIVIVVVLIALFGPLMSPFDPLKVDLSRRLRPPGWPYVFGTDQAGRDIFSRLLWGARPSLTVGVAAVIIAVVGGVPLGLLAGYFRGLTEQIIMRTVEVVASIPLLIWAIAVVGILGTDPIKIGPLTLPSESKLIMVVGILNIPGIARLMHSVAAIEGRADYVMARRSQGASTFSILVGDILPNCLSPIIVQTTLLIAVGIVIEASLSFIGLGVQPPRPSWGGMLADAKEYVLTGEWWLPVIPGLCISVAVVGFNLLGDALRDLLDPRTRTISTGNSIRTGVT